MTSRFDDAFSGAGRNVEFVATNSYRARLGATQDIVNDKNREKGIRAGVKAQCLQLRFTGRSDSTQSIQIEIDDDGSARDDEPFNRLRRSL